MNFGVELHAPGTLRGVSDSTNWRVCRVCYGFEALGHLCQIVAVAHPDLRPRIYPCENVVLVVDYEFGATIFSMLSFSYFALVLIGEELQSVAYSEYGHPEIECVPLRMRSVFCIDRARTAGQDNSLRTFRDERFRRSSKRKYFRIDA